MKQLVAALLCTVIPLVGFAAESNSYNIKYDGGSIQNVKAGSDLKLFIDAKQFRLTKDKGEVLTVQAASITGISYGQDVHRRVGAAIGIGVFTLGVGALMALTKSKKHFVGVTWDEGGNKGGFAFQADKNGYRGILTGLEGISGKKAINSDTKSVKN